MSDPLAWQDDALCAQVSQEMFFPLKGGSTRDAKRICATSNVGRCGSQQHETASAT